MKIPVLVLTGYLGSGKTTLINRILKENHGKRLAVIENEFGEVGVDNDLVLGADEEIFEMNNGCLCCTVRGDLIRILNNLGKRKDRMEMVLIETTGLADPGPVAQTFFMDPDVNDRFELKGVVTLADAFHLPIHLDSSPEVLRQIAFADLVVVNKTDLVSSQELEKLKDRLRGINGLAPLVEASQAGIPLAVIWNLAGFSLDRALALDGDFLLPERPYESALGLTGEPGLSLGFQTGPDQTALAYLQTGLEPALDLVQSLFEGETEPQPVDRLVPGVLSVLDLSRPGTLEVDLKPGEKAWLFFEHMPEEFALELQVQGQLREIADLRRFKPSHSHDDVTSVGLVSEKPLHPEKFNSWISGLLRSQGADIYRSKGILHIAGSPRKHIFQGVHMLLQGGDLGYWGLEKPQSRLVFIGKNLDRRFLTQGFLACQV